MVGIYYAAAVAADAAGAAVDVVGIRAALMRVMFFGALGACWSGTDIM